MWLFFFFKQKTAYEMRISDWSSDVCSSDLAERLGKDARQVFRKAAAGDVGERLHAAGLERGKAGAHVDAGRLQQRLAEADVGREGGGVSVVEPRAFDHPADQREAVGSQAGGGEAEHHVAGRSEEHTSELQSLMRIPYA